MSEALANRTTSMSRAGSAGYGATLVISAAVVQAMTGLATSTFVPANARPGTALFVYSGIWLTVTHVMVLAGIVVLARSSAAGHGWLKRVAFAIALVGFTAQVLGESVLRVNFDLGNLFFGIATPATGVGMILVGAAVLRAGVWTGWRRFAPLACGVYVPVVLIPAFIAAKGPSFIALAGWAVCYLALGLAMRAEQRV